MMPATLSVTSLGCGPNLKRKESQTILPLPSDVLIKSQHKLEEKLKNGPASYNEVYPGIILANGNTVKELALVKKLRVTHILNAAEGHVSVSSTQLAANMIHYKGFHVDDLPTENILRHLQPSAGYINDAIKSGGRVLVNCYQGLSRSASCVLAYLILYQTMSLEKALSTVSASRPIRPNEGFVQQLKRLEVSSTVTISGFKKPSLSLF